MTEKLAVVAIGGNSLIRDSKKVTVEDQYLAAKETTRHIADMIEAGWNVAIGHGNGPQVGFILRRSEIAHRVEGMHEVPLEVCGADSQGAIGYALQQNLQNEFKRRGIKKPVATVVTQVLVDKDDKAFEHPTKPIGGFMEEAEAMQRETELGWSVVEDAGRGWRRVVASPIPQDVVELASVKELLKAGHTVITVGGGGIPVIQEGDELKGIAAVIDKDYASSLLAREIKADLFLISTAVEKVAINYGKPDRSGWINDCLRSQVLRRGVHFAKGSMAPKIQAILWYLEAGANRRSSNRKISGARLKERRAPGLCRIKIFVLKKSRIQVYSLEYTCIWCKITFVWTILYRQSLIRKTNVKRREMKKSLVWKLGAGLLVIMFWLLPAHLRRLSRLRRSSRGSPAEEAAEAPAEETAAEEFVFGMLLVGPYNDRGYSQAHYEGGLYVEENVPGTKMVYLDKVNVADRPGTTPAQLAEELVDKGAKMVVFNSDDMKDSAHEFAAANPDIIVIHASVMATGQMARVSRISPIWPTSWRMEYGKMIAGCAAAADKLARLATSDH